MPSRGPVRYAVVGLGHIAQVAVLPAFAHARRNSRLVGARERRRGRSGGDRPTKYRVDATYRYDDYEACLEQVDAVYIALPNSLHAEYTIRAARAGVHVLCEKPMAVTVDECERMIEACRRAPRQADDRLPAALRGDQPGGDRPRAARQHRRAEVLQLVVLDDGAARQHPHEEGAAAAARSTTSASTASTPRATCSAPSRRRSWRSR